MAHNDMDVSAQSRKVALVLAESMRAVRAQRQWTQADVAERAGTTQDRISQIETGAADPRLSTVERIADALGLTVTFLDQQARDAA